VKKQAAACQLYVLPAREAPVAVILRRGPSRWYHVIRWHTDTDQFEHGAWFKGRIYEESCDLSPDGELLLYFALQGWGPWGTSYEGSWTAVSRVPWLHALGLWPQGDTWSGGGCFAGNRSIVLWSRRPDLQAHPDHPGLGLQIVDAPTPPRERFVRTGSDWSGRDHGGHAVHVSRGKLFRERLGDLVEIADFNGLQPDPQPPPDWARAPLAPAPARKKRSKRK